MSLNDIKKQKSPQQKYESNYECYADGFCSKLGRSEEAAHPTSKSMLKSIAHTDILHGDGAGGSTNPMLIVPLKKQAISSLHLTVVLLGEL